MSTRTYIKVRWLHSFPDEPAELWSELDEHRVELRKVEIWADGQVAYAGNGREVGDTGLSIAPLPPIEEIAADPQFVPEIVAAADFKACWPANAR